MNSLLLPHQSMITVATEQRLARYSLNRQIANKCDCVKSTRDKMQYWTHNLLVQTIAVDEINERGELGQVARA